MHVEPPGPAPHPQEHRRRPRRRIARQHRDRREFGSLGIDGNELRLFERSHHHAFLGEGDGDPEEAKQEGRNDGQESMQSRTHLANLRHTRRPTVSFVGAQVSNFDVNRLQAKPRTCFLPLALFACLAPACAEPSARDPLIAVPTGVIFPASRAATETILDNVPSASIESYWTPTPEVIAELESRLAPHLRDRLRLSPSPSRLAEGAASAARRGGSIFATSSTPADVRASTPRFRHRRRPRGPRPAMPRDQHHHDWGEALLLVEDVGDAHWQARYVVGEQASSTSPGKAKLSGASRTR